MLLNRCFFVRLLAFATCGLGATAQAQEVPGVPQVLSPLQVEPDVNNVNIATGQAVHSLPTLSIPADPGLKFDRVQNVAPYFVANLDQGTEFDPNNGVYSIHTGDAGSESFSCTQTPNCLNVTMTGSTFSPASRSFRQAGSGKVYQFTLLSQDTGFTNSNRSQVYYATRITDPSGQVLDISYDLAADQGSFTTVFRRVRVSRVTSNLGYYINIKYPSGANEFSYDWGRVQEAALFSNADPVNPLVRLTYGADGTITDLAGRVYRCPNGCENVMDAEIQIAYGTMTLPTESLPTQEFNPAPPTQFPAPIQVASAKRDGVTYSYSYLNRFYNADAGVNFYDGVTVVGPNGYNKFYSVRRASIPTAGATSQLNVIASMRDELNRTTTYGYDANARLTSIIFPEGNRELIAWDVYGDIVRRTMQAKVGSRLADLVETTFVDTARCTGVLCYRPIWHRDTRGNQTDYVYNANGQVIEQTDPADAAGVRRKTYITYESIAAGPGTLSRMKVVRVCGTGAVCGSNSEIRTEYDYWNNTFLPSVERRIDAGRGITATTTRSYDAAGRLLSVDGPLPGSQDATYNRYDVLGRMIWEIGATGTNGVRLARRLTYRDSDNRPIIEETGTIPNETSTVLTVFDRTDIVYDARRNPIRTTRSAGGTAYALKDSRFDDRNRMECDTIRMNPAAYGSLPASACTLGPQGGQGPDRITRNVYDAAGQLLKVQKAVGTPLQQDYATYTYSPNGKQTSVRDANGNLASMTYDGHDRQVRWNFPSKTAVGQVSTTDYEEYGYDASGNRTSLRKRDGSVITYQYDALNRNIVKIVPERPGLGANHTPDVYYGYDLRGLQIYARFDGPNGEGVSNAYDGFGRMTSSVTNMGGTARQLTYNYDNNGNRTQFTYPDGFGIFHYYDNLNRFSWTEGIAHTNYLPNGRRNGLYRDIGAYWGVPTYFAYGQDQRLSAMSHDIGGTAQDVSYSFGYNPANQITSRSTSNDAYVYTGQVDVNRNYTVNGLNQYASAGARCFEYDPNGNLTIDVACASPEDGSRQGYVFDVENRLVNAWGRSSAHLRYDPLGRLYEISGGSAATTTRFLYDGDALVAEYNTAGTMLRRYVHGVDGAADDPVAWYEGPGWDPSTRRYLYSNHQGSITGITDNFGNPLAINRYDEWGIPQTSAPGQAPTPGVTGRFGYTGQAWIPELGLYYYKARIYSPTLGRFLQTDPIGYEDQVNLYAYVGNDPVNNTDPTGLRCNDPDDANSFCDPENPDDDAPPIIVTGRQTTGGGSTPSSSPGGVERSEAGRGRQGQGRQGGRGCNQDSLNAFNTVRDFGRRLNDAGNKALVIAGGLAITAAATASTGVGAPAGLTIGGAASGLATTGLLAKHFGGSAELIGEIGASVETGTSRHSAGTFLARALIGIVPFSDDVVGALVGEAAAAVLPQTNIPKVCP